MNKNEKRTLYKCALLIVSITIVIGIFCMSVGAKQPADGDLQTGGYFQGATSTLLFRTGSRNINLLSGNSLNNLQIGNSPTFTCTLTAGSNLDLNGYLLISSGKAEIFPMHLPKPSNCAAALSPESFVSDI